MSISEKNRVFLIGLLSMLSFIVIYLGVYLFIHRNDPYIDNKTIHWKYVQKKDIRKIIFIFNNKNNDGKEFRYEIIDKKIISKFLEATKENISEEGIRHAQMEQYYNIEFFYEDGSLYKFGLTLGDNWIKNNEAQRFYYTYIFTFEEYNKENKGESEFLYGVGNYYYKNRKLVPLLEKYVEDVVNKDPKRYLNPNVKYK